MVRNPYATEITQAQQLLNFCNRNKLTENPEVLNVVAENRMTEALAKGKLQEGNARDNFVHSKKRPQKKKSEKEEVDPTLKLDFNLIM